MDLKFESYVIKALTFIEVPFIKSLRLLISKDEETSLGVFSVISFFIVVLYCFINRIFFLSALFDSENHIAILSSRLIILFILILFILSFKNEFFLIVSVSLSHVALLYYYNYVSILFYIKNNFYVIEILVAYIWWVSLTFSLRYFSLMAGKGRMNKAYYLNLFIFICMLFKYRK